MKLCAIDPGSKESAIVVWDGHEIHMKEKWDNSAVFDWLRSNACCDIVVIEKVASYGMAVGEEVFETCRQAGRFDAAASVSSKLPVFHIPRKEVKLHLCGQNRAKDSNIIQALKDRFGDKGTKANPGLTFGLKADMWQAFALAVTAFDNPKLIA